MGQISIRYLFFFLVTNLCMLTIAADEPAASFVEEGLPVKISHISNLSINIKSNPRQKVKNITQNLFCKLPEVPVRKYSGDLASLLYDYRDHIFVASLIAFCVLPHP